MRRSLWVTLAAAFLLIGTAFSALWIRSGSFEDVVVMRGVVSGGTFAVGTLGGRLYVGGMQSSAAEFECAFQEEPSRSFDWSSQDSGGRGACGFLWIEVNYPIWNWTGTVPLWFPIALAAGASGLCVWLARRRPAADDCPACGYDLRATPGRCPECGAEPGAATAALSRRRNITLAVICSTMCAGFLGLWSRLIGQREGEALPMPVNLGFIAAAVLFARLAFRSVLRVTRLTQVDSEQGHF